MRNLLPILLLCACATAPVKEDVAQKIRSEEDIRHGGVVARLDAVEKASEDLGGVAAQLERGRDDGAARRETEAAELSTYRAGLIKDRDQDRARLAAREAHDMAWDAMARTHVAAVNERTGEAAGWHKRITDEQQSLRDSIREHEHECEDLGQERDKLLDANDGRLKTMRAELAALSAEAKTVAEIAKLLATSAQAGVVKVESDQEKLDRQGDDLGNAVATLYRLGWGGGVLTVVAGVLAVFNRRRIVAAFRS